MPAQETSASTSTRSTASAEDAATRSPRERDRILLKRNPIASEYQVSGTPGASPGASADGEGVDFRAHFSLPPATPGLASAGIAATLTLHGGSGRAAAGGELSWAGAFGPDGATVLQLQARTSASDRAIEHYEAAWRQLPGTADADAAAFLDRPRFSRDLYDTRNTEARWRLDHWLSEGLRLSYEGVASVYDDTFYRNRLEYQFAGALVPESLERAADGSTIIAAEAEDAGIRRYFGNTVTDRQIHRHQLELQWQADRRIFGVSGYYSQWENQPLWDGWNFHDRGLDLSYAVDDPHLPNVALLDGADLGDLAQSVFDNFRIYDTTTQDTDKALRIDLDQQLGSERDPLWLLTGALWRTKERINAHDRQVFSPGQPFTLDTVAKPEGPGHIVRGAYPLPRGLDPEAARGFFQQHRETYFTFEEAASLIETAQDRYRAEETVGGVYFVASKASRRWKWLGGLRQEWTETATLGTVTGPRAILAPQAGEWVESVTLAGERYSTADGVAGSGAEPTFIKQVPAGNTYQHLLPSLQAEFAANNAWTLRAAYFQQMMRPQYYDIVEYRRVSAPTRTISEGNAGLAPTLIDNLSVAVEWNSGRVGSWSLELYAKEIEDFYYAATRVELIAGEDYTVSRVENGESGTIRGFQLQWSLDFGDALPGIDRARLTSAYTYSDSSARLREDSPERIPLPERADHLWESVLSLAWSKWQYSTTLAYQSVTLDQVGETRMRDTYRRPVLGWTHTLSRQVSKIWQLRLGLQNLLDHPERQYEGNSSRVTQNLYSSWTANVSASAQF